MPEKKIIENTHFIAYLKRHLQCYRIYEKGDANIHAPICNLFFNMGLITFVGPVSLAPDDLSNLVYFCNQIFELQNRNHEQ